MERLKELAKSDLRKQHFLKALRKREQFQTLETQLAMPEMSDR